MWGITSTILSIEKHEETLSNVERHKAEAFTALRVFCEVDAGLLTEQVIPLKMYLQCAEGVRSKEKMRQEAFLLKQFVPTMQKVLGETTSDDFDCRSLVLTKNPPVWTKSRPILQTSFWDTGMAWWCS